MRAINAARKRCSLTVVVAAACFFALTVAAPARAAAGDGDAGDASERCSAAFVEAQRQRNASSLLAARDHLGTCAQPSCPAVVRARCSTWLGEIAAEIPSARFVVRDDQGHEIETSVIVDEGRPGRVGIAVELDPGAHRVRALAPAIVQSFVLVAGQRAVVELKAPAACAGAPASPPTEPSARASDGTLLRSAVVGGATAGVELVLFAGVGLSYLLGSSVPESTALFTLVGLGVAIAAALAPPIAAALFHMGVGGDRAWLPAVTALSGGVALGVGAGVVASAVGGSLIGEDVGSVVAITAGAGAIIGVGVGAALGAIAADSMSDATAGGADGRG